VRLFLDSSVLLAAAGSSRGASSFIITNPSSYGWVFVTAEYCAEETRRNLAKLGAAATGTWTQTVAPSVRIVPTRTSLDRPLVFPKVKDRPVVITALAEKCEWLLTLDEEDFHGRLGREVYGMSIATPGEFLIAQREQGLL
jgi:hypothetical protein